MVEQSPLATAHRPPSRHLLARGRVAGLSTSSSRSAAASRHAAVSVLLAAQVTPPGKQAAGSRQAGAVSSSIAQAESLACDLRFLSDFTMYCSWLVCYLLTASNVSVCGLTPSISVSEMRFTETPVLETHFVQNNRNGKKVVNFRFRVLVFLCLINRLQFTSPSSGWKVSGI